MKPVCRFSHIVATCSALLLASVSAPAAPAGSALGSAPQCRAELVEGLGQYHMPITTSSSLAQRFFDQGMIWAIGFNHEAAVRDFRQAAQIDPQCAMCYWGVAYALGPNINAPMAATANEPAYQASRQAVALAGNVTKGERAFIDAMAKRYQEKVLADRSPLDRAYAEAMGKVSQAFPKDVDAAALYAEALMDTSPWHYWTKEGQPLAFTQSMLDALDRAMALDPQHLGANHFYIHAVEEAHPTWGIAAADRLRDLKPGPGHLVHMPGHIYLRVGRYHDGSVANQEAIAADQKYLRSCPTSGFYRMLYVPHNYAFLIQTSSLEGRSLLATATADELSLMSQPNKSEEHPMAEAQDFWVSPLLVAVHFGKWDKILAWPKPADHLGFAAGLWNYARAIALIRTGAPAEAQTHIDRLAELTVLSEYEKMMVMGANPVSAILSVGLEEARGELAASRGEWETAIGHLKKAVSLQDALRYMEPAPWYHSVRLALGAVLLDAKQPAEAERIYREDLAQYPENGWALFGLQQALSSAGRSAEAASVHQRFEKAWRRADVTLLSSRF